MSARRRATVAALLPLLWGCATLFQGSTQMVQISSDPPGAKVTVLPERDTLVTPGEIDLKRMQVHTLLFERACYEPATAYLDRDFSKVAILSAFLMMTSIDIGSGAAFVQVPDPLHVTLTPAKQGSDAACQAAIR